MLERVVARALRSCPHVVQHQVNPVVRDAPSPLRHGERAAGVSRRRFARSSWLVDTSTTKDPAMTDHMT